MTQLTDQILRKVHEIKDAEARLSAATDFWADRQKEYLTYCEMTTNAKVLNVAQIKAIVAYETVLDAIAFKGRMTCELEDLKKERGAAISKRVAARRNMGRKGGPQAPMEDA